MQPQPCLQESEFIALHLFPGKQKSSLCTQASRSHKDRDAHTCTRARAHTLRHLSRSYCSTRMNSNGRPRANKCQYALFPRGGLRRYSVHTVNCLAVYLPDNSRSSAPQTSRWTDRQSFFFFQGQISLRTVLPLHLRRAQAGRATTEESETMGSDTERE